MWVMTQDGFYSVVKYLPELDEEVGRPASLGSLLIRARAKVDLEALREYLPELDIWVDEVADYRFRAIVTVDEWTRCLAGIAGEIDYGNFKNQVLVRQGSARADLYHQVWSALLPLQEGS